MSFKILVLSPLHQSGASVVSLLMAQGLTWASKSTTLSYTDALSYLPKYLGLDMQNDPTRSIMQVSRLIDSGSLEDSEILDFAECYSKNAHILSFSDENIDHRDLLQIVKHVYKRVPTDICVVDGSMDIDDKVTDSLINSSDLVFVVVSPSMKDYVHLKYWMTQKKIGEHSNLNVIVNHYDETVSSLRDIAKHIGMSANRVCKIHENPWIRKCCLTGSLHTIMPQVKGFDPRVANLSSDISEITQCVVTAMLSANKYSKEDSF